MAESSAVAMPDERYPRHEERWNAALHGLGAVLAVAGSVLLVVQADHIGRSGSVPAAAAYGAALVLLFVFSALHHAVVGARLKQALLALDHCGIYLLIAGTYTPFCLLLPPGREANLLGLIWGLAATGITLQLAAFLLRRSHAYERIAFLFYLAMGWIPIVWAGADVLDRLPAPGFWLLVAGGVAYTVGVLFYLWKRLPYGHAIWHLFVLAASGLHFFSILLYVIPAPE